MTVNGFKAQIMDVYGIAGEEKHNKNLEIMVDCYTEKYTEFTLEAFAEYVNSGADMQVWLDRGAFTF